MKDAVETVQEIVQKNGFTFCRELVYIPIQLYSHHHQGIHNL